MSCGFSVFLLWKKIPLRELTGKGWLAALFLASSTSCFVFSLQYTHVANTLVIIATSPLLAALMSWVFLREKVPLVTWVAILVAMLGVALSLADGFQRDRLLGEVLALGSALSMASHFIALRWWKSDYGSLSVWGAGILVALLTLPLADPFSVPRSDIGWLFLLGAVVLPLAFGMMAVGPRYLPAPEVGLLLLGETVLGPIWVWLALDERPGQATLLGGLIVVGTLFCHSLYRRRYQKS